MIKISIHSLSQEMNITIDELIKKFSNIGLIKSKNDFINLHEKKLLLHYLSSKNELSFNNTNVKNNIKRNVGNKKFFDKRNITVKHVSKNINVNNNKKLHIKKNINYSIKNKIERDQLKKNDTLITINKNQKKNDSLKIVEKFYPKRDVHIPNPANHKKISVNNFKKNKSPSSKLKIKSTPFNHDLKKLVNLKKLDDVNNIIEYDNVFRNKKNKIKNQKKIVQNNTINVTNNKNFQHTIFSSTSNAKKNHLSHYNFIKPKSRLIKNIVLNETISVLELANKMSLKSSEIIQKMMDMGSKVTINQILDQETAQLLIEEMGHKAIIKRDNILEEKIIQEHKKSIKKYIKKPKSPVVTIMGHVDHGKTSLLDYIRSTQVAKNEFGGITQHIGAYYVKTNKGMITFLDTPGHAAFTAMRARGVQVTDIVVLVVAGDDGVKPQTIEAIQHVKAAKVPLIVAINKIDKIESNVEKVTKELMKYEIVPEKWGGDTIFVSISSLTGKGINDLLNAILLQSEMLELFASPSGLASGVVIEASLDKYRGPVATVLIQEGELKKGDNILCGTSYGRIRAIRDSVGRNIKSSGPSIPIEILGLSSIPASGDIFYVVKNEHYAREVVEYRKNQFRLNKFQNNKKINLDDIFENLKNKSYIELNIILKSDVQGSLEAILYAINSLQYDNVNIKIISSNVGSITETDVSLAIASNAIIIGFNVKPNVLAKKLIKIENVDTRFYSVIYNLIDDIKLSISGMITPTYKTLILGSAEVRNIFKPTKSIFIAGCMVTNGIIKRNNSIQILRNNRIIYKCELESLRRFKEDIKEVGMGKECGIGIKNYYDIKIGDVIESIDIIEVKKTL